jgi:predicted nucleotidyltransferase
MMKVDLSVTHVELVKSILRDNLEKGVIVWIFGSRVRGTAKPYSDIDLAIDNNQAPLSFTDEAKLKEAFEDSSLPFSVDIVDLNSVSEEFKNLIQDEKALFLEVEGTISGVV